MITLHNIKTRIRNEHMWNVYHETWELNEYNNNVRKRRIKNGQIDYLVYDLTHQGKDPYLGDFLLDRAKCYYDSGVYTDEEWNEYFLPAINEQIEYYNNFVRWHPGFLIEEKETGKKLIVNYDYAEAFGGTDFKSISVCTLSDEGQITGGWAWANYDCYNLIDNSEKSVNENIEKIRNYNRKYNENPPYFLSPEMIKLLYY